MSTNNFRPTTEQIEFSNQIRPRAKELHAQGMTQEAAVIEAAREWLESNKTFYEFLLRPDVAREAARAGVAKIEGNDAPMTAFMEKRFGGARA